MIMNPRCELDAYLIHHIISSFMMMGDIIDDECIYKYQIIVKCVSFLNWMAILNLSCAKSYLN